MHSIAYGAQPQPYRSKLLPVWRTCTAQQQALRRDAMAAVASNAHILHLACIEHDRVGASARRAAEHELAGVAAADRPRLRAMVSAPAKVSFTITLPHAKRGRGQLRPHIRARTGLDVARGERSPGAGVLGVRVSPVPVQMWPEVGPVPVQVWPGASPAGDDRTDVGSIGSPASSRTSRATCPRND